MTRLIVAVLVVPALAVLTAELVRSGPSRPMSVESFCPGGSQRDPNVLLCDDFEGGTVRDRWEISSNRDSLAPAQFVACTNDAFGFKDRCAAWSNSLRFDNAWGFYGYDARRSFASESELYVRWYQ